MDNILYICLLLMIVIIAIISPSFISVRVLSDVLTQSAPKMLLAVGMLVVIIAGGMDMTVGRLAGLGAVVSGTLAQQSTYYIKFWPSLPEMPLIVPIVASIIVGIISGVITGLIISKLKVPAFPCWSWTSADHLWWKPVVHEKAPNNSQPLAGFKESFTKFGTGSVAGVNYLIIVAFVVMIAVYIILNMTTLGKKHLCYRW